MSLEDSGHGEYGCKLLKQMYQQVPEYATGDANSPGTQIQNGGLAATEPRCH